MECAPCAHIYMAGVRTGWLRRAAYMPPLRMTRYVVANEKSRAGRAPPLPRGDFYVLQSPRIFLSSVTCGDSFPQGGSLWCGLPDRLVLAQGGKEGAPLRMTRYVVANEKSRAVTAHPQGGKTPVRSNVMSREGAVHQDRCFFASFLSKALHKRGNVCYNHNK